MSLAEQFIVQAGVIAAPPKPARPTVVEIQRAVAAYYAMDPADMKSKGQSHAIAHPRQIAMYLVKKLTPNTLPAIGRLFGNRDHSTVIHAIRQVERRFADPDDDAGSDVRAICEALANAVEARPIGEILAPEIERIREQFAANNK